MTTTTERKQRVALVCDWLTTPGGAEKVLLELHHMYPAAPIYTSQYDRRGIDWFADADVRTGWLQIFPSRLRKFLGPLRQLYFSHLDLSSYDLVISVTGAEAKSVRTRPKKDGAKGHTTHLCYCHVPTQYYWQMSNQYLENPGFGFLNPLVRFFLKLLLRPLRRADLRAAARPDQFITISTYAREQIKKYYHRDAIVVAPPVDIEQFIPRGSTFPPQTRQKSTAFPPQERELSTESYNFSTTKADLSTSFSTKTTKKSTENSHLSTTYPQEIHNKTHTYPQKTAIFPQDFHSFYIIACRQATWKRVDLAISACRRLGLPLLVVGDGPEHTALTRLAGDSAHIRFLPWTDSAELARCYQRASGYLFPSLEPFGIAAVEALAAGCPVLAYRDGGSRDFIEEGKNGLFFDHQTVASLAAALQRFETTEFDRAAVSASAARFAPTHFREGINTVVKQARKESKS